jgi:hypothetical protein
MRLQHTKMYRGGVTTSALYQEDTTVSIEIDTADLALSLRFGLKSKGGGRTLVLLNLGLEDLPWITSYIDRLRKFERDRLRKRIDELEAELATSIPGIIGGARPK